MKQIGPLGALKTVAYMHIYQQDEQSVSFAIQLCYGSRESPVSEMIGNGLDNRDSIPDRGK
jgi:hypothetical protein